MKTLEIITQAIQPMEAVIVERAIQAMEDKISEAYIKLQAADWDRKVVAPYPDSRRVTASTYHAMTSYYRFIGTITRSRNTTRTMGEPDFCDSYPQGARAEVNNAAQQAKEAFEAYALKLASKAGAIVKAEAHSLHDSLWADSDLVTHEADGRVQVWNTKTIVNCSKFGKLFFQFPTRVKK